MVATRAAARASVSDEEADLRRCVRDLVALSSLPAIWIRADGRQIADGLAQLVLSILDAEFVFVRLENPDVEILHRHERAGAYILDLATAREVARPNTRAMIDLPPQGKLHTTCVPLGRGNRSALAVFSFRPKFPLATEQMLVRVAANLASIAIQRWSLDEERKRQTELLEWLNETGAALYTLTDRLFRAQSHEEIYDAALEAITRSLRCQRASILLFDDLGVMRFVAFRGLSEAYRGAVEGHSPWGPRDTNVVPVLIGDVETAAGVAESLKAVVRAEGIAALAFIPIMANEAVIGKFMAYYDAVHRFEEKETNAAMTIARQLGFGLERLRAERSRRLLVAELSHRVKNTLSTVISIARQSFTSVKSMEVARRSFDGRIRALAHTHTQLADANWSGVSLEALIGEELAPYRSHDRCNVRAIGPHVTLNPRAAVVLGMALHELATNAAKYGALSNGHGSVEVTWSMLADTLKLLWVEAGGPPVRPPERSGFGRLMLERALVSDVGGKVNLEFAPAGLICRIALAAKQCVATQ